MLNINIVNKIYHQSDCIPPRLTDNSKLILSVLKSISTKAATYKELISKTGLTADKVRYCKEYLVEAGIVTVYRLCENGKSKNYIELK